MSLKQSEVAIVGAGPIGLELAVALKHAGVDYVHLDKSQIGHTVSWYPRQTQIFSSPERIAIAGVPLLTPDQTKATGEQYLAYLRGIVEQFDLRIKTYESVTAIERADSGFKLHTRRRDRDYTYTSRYVVLAIGDMHRPRQLNIPGEDLDHVSHYFDRPHPYFRRKLLIVGGRNSAVEAAIRCWRAGARVALSYRQTDFDEHAVKYWLLPELKSLIKTDRIRYHPGTKPTRITPEAVTLEKSDGRSTEVSADFVLALVGYEMDESLLRGAAVELTGQNRRPVHDPDTMQTNVPGLYIVGTVAAGTQVRFKLFIENCHPHVSKVVTAITGYPPPANLVNDAVKQYALPES